jgi:hypothetical protein
VRRGFAQKVVEMDIPLLSKEGCPSHQTLDCEGGVVTHEPRSAPYLLKLITTPSAPLRKGIILLMAQPPLPGKEGNVHLGVAGLENSN